MDEQTMLQIEWDTLDMIIQDSMCTFKSLLLRNNPDLTVETTNFRYNVNGRAIFSKGLFVYDARVGRDVNVSMIPHYWDDVLNINRYVFVVHSDDLNRVWRPIATGMAYVPGCNWNSQLFADVTAATFRELVSERHLA